MRNQRNLLVQLMYISTGLGVLVWLFIVLFAEPPFLISALDTRLDTRTVLVLIGVAALLIVLLITMAYRRVDSSLPVAHTVAVIGNSRAGKSTMITVIFGELFAQKVLGVRATPAGVTTVDRVNEDLAKLEQRITLGPTKDQDMFGYRSNIAIHRRFSNRVYKVTIGDFAGQASEDYASFETSRLEDLEAFGWIAESDALIFVVDLGKYIYDFFSEHRNFVAECSSDIRRVWQRYLIATEGGPIPPRRHPVVLVFSKADLFEVHNRILSYMRSGEPFDRSNDEVNQIQSVILEFGLGHRTPPLHSMDTEVLAIAKPLVERDFSSLIAYLQAEAEHFSIVYSSAFATVDGKRLGMADIVIAMLPR